MAENKFLDSNGVLYLWQKIKAAFASASDMTQAKSDIQALQNAGGQANVIESVKRNGTALTITNKAVDVTVPTKTSDLTNDSHYVADADYVHTDSNFTAAEKSKLSGIAEEANKTVVATSITASGTNPVTSKAIYDALAGKQDELTFDTAATSGSTNPVTSGGIYTALGKKANLASPTFTGTPKAPTAAAATDNTQIATTAFVHDVADGKADAATTLAGYGITDAYTKSEVDAAISTGTALDIDTSPTSGSTHLVTSGGVYTALSAKAPLASPNFTGNPTAPTQSIEDSSTAIATTAYVNACVSSYIQGITVFSISVVSSLPTVGAANTMYFVPNSGSGNNVYDEYIYLLEQEQWEKIGTTEVDLSNYMLKSDMVAITNAEIDTIVAS